MRVILLTLFTICLCQGITTATSTGTHKDNRQARSSFLKSLWDEQESPWKMDRNKSQELFENYYNCLRNETEGAQKNAIEAILAIEGQRIIMTCKICLRPGSKMEEVASWQHLRQADTTMEYIWNSDRMKVDGQNNLIITEVDITDIGQFTCVENDSVQRAYQLDVVLTDRRRLIDSKHKPAADVKMKKRNLLVMTRWSSWSKCSTCDRPGKKRKFGLCIVKKLDKKKPIKPWDLPLMNLYQDGMPCQSKLLPRQLSKIPEISNRQDEIMVGDCLIKCPKEKFKVVKNKRGQYVETILPGYQPMSKKPVIPKMTIRKLIHEVIRNPLTLKCPRSSQRDFINWQRSKAIISPVSIKEMSRGRVSIDNLHRLIFQSLRREDTASYSCWNRENLVAVYKVIVTKAPNKTTKRYISFVGFILTSICVTIILICVCIRRKSKTLK